MARPNRASEIQVLPGLEAVRKNPWMYVGSVFADGAHQLLFEVIYNGVDEALAGACSRIDVSLSGQSARVSDDGRGIPTERHPTAGIPASEVVFTTLHSGSKFSRRWPRFSAGLHGVGLSCVNALSKSLRVEIRRGGRVHVQEFSRGRPKGPPAVKGRTRETGTTISFRPDPAIFKGFSGFDAARCRRLLEELSYLNPGLRFSLDGRSFQTTAGVAGLLGRLAEDVRSISGAPMLVRVKKRDWECEAALLWTTGREPLIRSFVNGVATTQGGTHAAAFRLGVARALNRLMAEAGRKACAEDAVELDEAV